MLGMSQMDSVIWRVHRRESSSDNLCAWDGSMVWPILKRKKAEIVFLLSFKLWIQGWAGIVGKMFLYEVAKLGDILVY